MSKEPRENKTKGERSGSGGAAAAMMGERPTTRNGGVVATRTLEPRAPYYELRALSASAGGDPVEEALHAGAFTPHQGEEFVGVEIGGFVAEEGFHAPLNVGGAPGAEAVTFRDDPVVAESVQHVAEIGNWKFEIEMRLAQRGLRADGRIGAGAMRGR